MTTRMANLSSGETLGPSRIERLTDRIATSRIGRMAWRYRRMVPFVSFAMGAASFFLVERQAQLAQWVTALMLLGWVALPALGLWAGLRAGSWALLELQNIFFLYICGRGGFFSSWSLFWGGVLFFSPHVTLPHAELVEA